MFWQDLAEWDHWTDFKKIYMKEKEKKYVPFDLSNPEVRKGLRGKWIKADGDEAQISGFHKLGGKEWMASITTGYVTNTTLLKRWTFEDGSPCGKEVE